MQNRLVLYRKSLKTQLPNFTLVCVLSKLFRHTQRGKGLWFVILYRSIYIIIRWIQCPYKVIISMKRKKKKKINTSILQLSVSQWGQCLCLRKPKTACLKEDATRTIGFLNFSFNKSLKFLATVYQFLPFTAFPFRIKDIHWSIKRLPKYVSVQQSNLSLITGETVFTCLYSQEQTKKTNWWYLC